VPLAAGTDPDELAGAYDRVSGRLMSPRERLAAKTTGPDQVSASAEVELSPDAADLIADMSGQEGDESAAGDGIPQRTAGSDPPGG